MAFHPLGDRVAIRRVEEQARTKGGIIIPDTVKEKPQEGEVVAVGPGAWDEHGKRVPMAVKSGDSARLVTFPLAGHFEIANPFSTAWPTVEDEILALLEKRQKTKE